MPYMIENRMVVDREWPPMVPQEQRGRLNGAGYAGIWNGVFVPEEDAFGYAVGAVSSDEELKKEFLEWFYSGDWVKED